MFERGFWIVLSGTAGELARHFVPNPEGQDVDLAVELSDWMHSTSVILMAGDTITFEEGETECL
jgi:hypothetical protein